MTQRIAALVLSLLALTACGEIGRVEPHPWELQAMSPSETQLLVRTFFGGVASGCSRFEGWDVDETDERVEITANLWSAIGPRDCTDDGGSHTVVAQLDAPLGNRELVGCIVGDCSAESGLIPGDTPVPSIAANEEAVVVLDELSWSIFDSAGDLVSTAPAALLQRPLAVADLFVFESNGSIEAFDPRLESTRWTSPGSVHSVDGTEIFSCVETDQDSGLVSSIDAESGEIRWAVTATCAFVAATVDSVTVLGHDPAVDGGSQLIVVDRTTGEVVVRRPFDDGTDDRVNGTRGLTSVGGTVVAFGWQSDTVVLDPNGDEITRRSERLGVPIGATQSLLLTALEQEVIATDPATGEVIWRRDRRHAGGQRRTFILDGDGLWFPDPGVITKIDANTGDVAWSTPVPIGVGTSLALTNEVVYASGPLSLTAFDRETGDELWSSPLTWSGEYVTPADSSDAAG